MNRILVAVVIGVILALGLFFGLRLNDNQSNNAGDVPEGETQPESEGQLDSEPLPVVVERAGKRIELRPIPDQYAIIIRERREELNPSGREPIPIVTIAPGTQPVINPTATPLPTIPPPTQVPSIATITPIPGICGTVTTAKHTVVDGDTLFKLTQLYTTSLVQLAEYGITDAVMIVGNVIDVPTTGCVCHSGRTHVVQRGQNVFRLAIQYGTTKEAIRDLNGLDANYLILVGQKLCLP